MLLIRAAAALQADGDADPVQEGSYRNADAQAAQGYAHASAPADTYADARATPAN